MIYFMETCVHAIRTLPTLQHDANRIEDVDSDGEDHAPDEIRYACMSRPYLPANMPKNEPVFPGIPIGIGATKNTVVPTMEDLWRAHGSQRGRSRI